MAWKGEVIAIYVRPELSAPVLKLEHVRAVPGRGLEGDYYFDGISRKGIDPSREVTLIESEALDAIERDYSVALGNGQSRRNIITRDVPLNHLVGQVFQVGAVTLRGIRLCEPCSHLAGLTNRGVLPALVHRGGLRAQILTEGVLKVGDQVIQPESEQDAPNNA
jgi:MOSC domain-containing protein YiiM